MDKFIVGVLFILFFGIFYAVLVALPVMLLWNWLVVSLFNLRVIDFWEALGLSVLCSLLFKGSSSSSSNSGNK